ncbi:hypothetical protein HDF26_004699 [Pedobacter cryoconitis]|uniref:HNH endonuclease n=1 Tax=Pedobacter cryoconitis TaxID=188932 RepID=UPI001609411A|nr:HNH endonuclease signature motif containing protein [Pedobacter cryoconitis]MBB6274225.1 hypothetical protein [Pedobacter cryoconitis]
MNEVKVGDRFEGVLLETCIDNNISRPRVRPVSSSKFPSDIRVEFPTKLREENRIGTRFRADLKVSQKTNKINGVLIGSPYLVVSPKTIEVVDNFIPQIKLRAIKLNTTSNRVYAYVSDEMPVTISFIELRAKAYERAKENPQRYNSTTTLNAIERSKMIVTYALLRANGNCEGCDDPAPFLRENGEPYLEVHHIDELGNGGSDSPRNVIALCPNCHRRVTYSEDKEEYNGKLKLKITQFEDAI